MPQARYLLGLDLGTTHTVLASADLGAAQPPRGRDATHIFSIDQRISATSREARSMLASTLYAPLDAERASSDEPTWIVGEHARARGVEAPARFIASAKSWLAHGGVDRTAKILPWGLDGEGERTASDAPRLSPIDASAAILRHVRDAWDGAHPEAPFREQSIVLTVPASFDEVARALTVEATRRAGIDEASLRLLEEPQAAFLDWAAAAGDEGLRALLGAATEAEVLVCDVGGGTTDFSLMRIAADAASPGGLALARVAVGDHLLLGGDNMDLALAHRLEPRLVAEGERLSASRFAQLALACRAAKEALVAGSASPVSEVTVTLLSAGSKLVAAARRTALTRDDFREVVLDGFFPIVTREQADTTRARGRTGLVAFGLPYASDPAVTRHLARFLSRHSRVREAPIALLLNGGVFNAPPIVARLVAAVEALTGHAPAVLPNGDPDLAVARGAVAYGLALRGVGRRIGGGSARGYYVGLAAEASQANVSRNRAVCVMPRGTEAGVRTAAEGRLFALTLGRSARFDLFATSGEASSGDAADRAGDIVTIDDERFTALPPLATVIGEASTARAGGSEVSVQLEGELTEIGTLRLECVEVDGTRAVTDRRRYKLDFDLRAAEEGAAQGPSPTSRSLRPPSTLPPRSFDRRLDEARAKLDRVFGKALKQGELDPREAKQLTRELERILGERATWPTSIVRPLFDDVRVLAAARRRSADHERAFWSLTGYLLRPGFGDPLDARRIEELEPLYAQGLAFAKDAQGFRAWWIAWRRVAGGLSEATQLAIRETLDPFLAPSSSNGPDGKPRKKPKNVRPEPFDEVLLLASSLERVPPSRRSELGAWLLERTWTSNDPHLYAAIGRIGARVPAYASAHHVVSPRVAESWLTHVLRADWREIPTLPFAAVQLARLTGDRARDVSEATRLEVAQRLERGGQKPEWVRSVREVVTMDETQRRELFGEALPVGLRLIGE